MNTGGVAVQKAGRNALDDGSPEAVARVPAVDLPKAQEEGDRVQAPRLTNCE